MKEGNLERIVDDLETRVIHAPKGMDVMETLDAGAKSESSPDTPLAEGHPKIKREGLPLLALCRMYENGESGIILFNPATSEVTDVCGGCKPRWSPDGGRLAFIDSRSHYVIVHDGSKNQAVFYDGRICTISDVSWYGNEHLMMAGYTGCPGLLDLDSESKWDTIEHPRALVVYNMSWDGKEVELIGATPCDSFDCVAPSFSKSGTVIVSKTRVGPRGSMGGMNWASWMISQDGAYQELYYVYPPKISHNGKWYCHLQSSPNRLEVIDTRSGEKTTRNVKRGKYNYRDEVDYGSPALWSPDDTRILINYPRHIVVADMNGRNHQQIRTKPSIAHLDRCDWQTDDEIFYVNKDRLYVLHLHSGKSEHVSGLSDAIGEDVALLDVRVQPFG